MTFCSWTCAFRCLGSHYGAQMWRFFFLYAYTNTTSLFQLKGPINLGSWARFSNVVSVETVPVRPLHQSSTSMSLQKLFTSSVLQQLLLHLSLPLLPHLQFQFSLSHLQLFWWFLILLYLPTVLLAPRSLLMTFARLTFWLMVSEPSLMRTDTLARIPSSTLNGRISNQMQGWEQARSRSSSTLFLPGQFLVVSSSLLFIQNHPCTNMLFRCLYYCSLSVLLLCRRLHMYSQV